MTMRAGDVYEQPLQRLVGRERTAETGGERLPADLYVPPGTAGVPRHLHPALEEHITVVYGRISVWIHGQEKVLEPGERLDIPPGSTHSWWPVGEQEAHALLDVHPAARFECHWRQFMGLAQDGKIHPKRGPRFL
jgi:quercetin dioxygenase-like cupin family protein